ncbi:Uncharacterised protein [Salmonella bongori]|nr:Uncharacterised protein [Salmonella bongori]
MRNTEIRSFNTDSDALARIADRLQKKKSVKTARSLFPSALRRWLSISPKRV